GKDFGRAGNGNRATDNASSSTKLIACRCNSFKRHVMSPELTRQGSTDPRSSILLNTGIRSRVSADSRAPAPRTSALQSLILRSAQYLVVHARVDPLSVTPFDTDLSMTLID